MATTKLRIALLVNRDPTAKGVILTELQFFNTIFNEREDVELYLVATSKHYMKIAMTIQKHFKFPTKLIMIENYEGRGILKKFHAIITWTMACNFYGGAVSPRIVEVYNLISYFTNEVKRPVLIRLPDSEIQVMDYKKVIDVRVKSDKPDGKFSVMNEEWIKVSQSVEYWDYSQIFWMANGREDIFDWIVESVWDKIKEPHRVSNRDEIKSKSIYLSDDIFFLIRDHYKKFEHFSDVTDSKEFGYVGFFTTLNKKRAIALNKIWKKNEFEIPIEIIGKGTEEIKDIGKFDNVNIQERLVKGIEYWKYLNSHLGYVFVGKGNPINRYINKTIYDCVCARTPVILFKPTDTNHVGMISDEMYFETEAELFEIYKKLLIPEERSRIIKEQKEDVFSRLSDASLDLSFIQKPEIEEIIDDDIMKLNQTKYPKKNNDLAKSLF